MIWSKLMRSTFVFKKLANMRNSQLAVLNSQILTRKLELATRKFQLTTHNSQNQLAHYNSQLANFNSQLATLKINSHATTRNSQILTRNSQLASYNSQLANFNSQLAKSTRKLQLATRTRNYQLATRNSQLADYPNPQKSIQSFFDDFWWRKLRKCRSCASYRLSIEQKWLNSFKFYHLIYGKNWQITSMWWYIISLIMSMPLLSNGITIIWCTNIKIPKNKWTWRNNRLRYQNVATFRSL